MKTFNFELEFYNNTEFKAVEIMKLEGTLDDVFREVENLLPIQDTKSLERILPNKKFYRSYLWCRSSKDNNIVFAYVYENGVLNKNVNHKFLSQLREEESEV
jgi:hypothetical protein